MIITQDKIIEVPYVLEKIAEKIIMMPQIVEVLKYVHEIIDDGMVNAVSEISSESIEYKKLGEGLEKELSVFLEEIRKYRQPGLSTRVDVIERYLTEFRKFIKHPRLYEKIVERAVEKDRKVVVPVPHHKTAEE